MAPAMDVVTVSRPVCKSSRVGILCIGSEWKVLVFRDEVVGLGVRHLLDGRRANFPADIGVVHVPIPGEFTDIFNLLG